MCSASTQCTLYNLCALMLCKVHTELEKLRTKNREENARARAEARFAYEQRMQDVTNDSLADASSLAGFIESSVAGMVTVDGCDSRNKIHAQMHCPWNSQSASCTRACTSNDSWRT